MQRSVLVVTLVCAALLSSASAVRAQGFGKNKVHYETLSWAVLETPHVRLHYYAEEESLARRLVAVSESICVEYDRRFRLEFRAPIPVLLYSAHHLFQQTNATPGLISESVGGITELIKGRVLIPHNGSWARLEWVTRHELAHAYMLEKLARVMKDHRRSQSYLPPLWFIEGFAEFCATTWDADAEGLLRDAVLSDRAYKLTESGPITGTVLMYKEGQSFLLYLADRFGPEKVFEVLENWYRSEDFETTFRLTYGESVRNLDEEWFTAIKKRYYPVIAKASRAREVGEKLTRRGRFNLGARALPAAEGETPRGPSFCYFEAREASIDLILSQTDKRGRRHETRLLSGGRSASFESFHLFQNRPDASPSGLIAVSSKRGGRDAIYLVDSKRRRVQHRISFSKLVAILDPSLAPGDEAVVFSAQDYSGRSDLYRASWGGKRLRLERLTNDDFDDRDPDISPDGKWVVFSSDRCERGGRYSLFRLSLAGGVPEPVSDPEQGDDRQPVYSPDGRWIAFRSTRGGTSDLYVRPAEPSREARRVTRLIGPALDPDWLADSRTLLFTGQDRVEFQSYRVSFDPDTLPVELEEPHGPLLAELEHETVHLDPTERDPVYYTGLRRPYERRLGIDMINNALAVDPGTGAAGGGQLAISDLLGNEHYQVFLTNSGDRFGGFWQGFEIGVTYFNQSRRLNYGLGLFRLNQVYDADYDVVRSEPRVGVLALASYPFSKFTRVQGSVTVRHANDHLLRSGESKSVDLVTQSVAFIYDNSAWTWLGPSAGSRVMVSAGFTRDLTSGLGDYTTLAGEYRQYLHPLPMVVSATRFKAQTSFGRDAQRVYLGGANSVRGFDWRDLSGMQAFVTQQEFRTPLLRGLTFAVPSAWQFPVVNGAVFADAAWAFDGPQVRQLGSVGTGVYIGGGYSPAIRWNFAWVTTDFHSFSRTPVTQFMIVFDY